MSSGPSLPTASPPAYRLVGGALRLEKMRERPGRGRSALATCSASRLPVLHRHLLVAGN
jgi:hypothetical protein